VLQCNSLRFRHFNCHQLYLSFIRLYPAPFVAVALVTADSDWQQSPTLAPTLPTSAYDNAQYWFTADRRLIASEGYPVR
jgi:hypothetical protein